MEFHDKSSVPPAIAEIIRSVNAFRMKIGWINYLATNSTPTVHKIPSSVTTLPALNQWIFDHHTPGPRDVLASIAADDTRIAINVQHAVADSRYLVSLCERICDPSSYGERAVPPLSESAYEYFAKQIQEHDPQTTCSGTAEISRVFPQKPLVPAKKSRFVINYICEPISSFKCYDSRAGGVRSFTEALYMALALSNAAFDGGVVRGFGLSTVVDLRRFCPPERLRTNAQQNWVASVQVHTRPVLTETVGDVQRRLRAVLDRRLADGSWLGHMRNVREMVMHPWRKANPAPGLGIELSSVGPVRIRRPVKDCHLTMIVPGSRPYQGISFLNYSLTNVDVNRAEFLGQFQHTTMELNEQDGRLLRDSVRFSLQNTVPTQTIGEAIDDIRRFQERWTDAK
jgi:hypothetical protein